jgi:hypothetical protein
MAGIAGDLAMALEVVFVDRHHHVDHLARGDFGLFVVLFVRVFNMAVLAFNAERSRNELHRGNDLLGGYTLKGLNIFELLFSEFGCGGARSKRWRWNGLRRGSRR